MWWADICFWMLQSDLVFPFFHYLFFLNHWDKVGGNWEESNKDCLLTSNFACVKEITEWSKARFNCLILAPNMNSVPLKTNKLLTYHCGCHGNLFTNSNEVCSWCLLSQGTSIPNMDTIWLKTKVLLTYHCGCHGNLVTIATRYVADAYCPKEPLFQIWMQ